MHSYITFINDLPNIIDGNIKMTIYANDTAITFTYDNNTQLNEINKIQYIQYKLNKLKLNLDKIKINSFNPLIHKDNSIILNNT